MEEVIAFDVLNLHGVRRVSEVVEVDNYIRDWYGGLSFYMAR
jgi:hypothetical protein